MFIFHYTKIFPKKQAGNQPKPAVKKKKKKFFANPLDELLFFHHNIPLFARMILNFNHWYLQIKRRKHNGL
jgi:hypothetical protein